MTDAEAFIEGAMWARAELTANLTDIEVAEQVTRGLFPSSVASPDTFREQARAAAERRGSDA